MLKENIYLNKQIQKNQERYNNNVCMMHNKDFCRLLRKKKRLNKKKT